jgi:hypothetical protein
VAEFTGQGIQTTDLEVFPFIVPQLPIVGKAFDAIGDFLGNLLEKAGLRKPTLPEPIKCPRGSANPKVKAKATRGSTLHAGRPGLIDQQPV